MRVFSVSYHVGFIRYGDDKFGAPVCVCPNTIKDVGYLDTYLIPKTAYHIMALTDGPTIKESEHIPFKMIYRPMCPIDKMDGLVLMRVLSILVFLL